MKELYVPEPISGDADPVELRSYLQRELDAIRTAISSALPREIEFLHAEPAKLRDGLIVGADGTDWDPGSGQGVYAYYAGAWNKLG